VNLDRDRCVLTGDGDLVHVAGFDAFPVYMGCTDGPVEDDIVRPMQWWQSAGSGVLQLRPLLELDLVYLAAHNAMVGETWEAHHSALTDLIVGQDPRNVFELAGADGALAMAVLTRLPDCRWTCVDTNPTVHDDDRLTVITGVIDDTLTVPDGTDLVVHSHFLEHAYRPRQLLEALARGMAPGTRMAFSVPNQVAQFEAGYGNVLNFEHTYFLRREYLEWLLAVTGFSVVERAPFRDHSLQYVAERADCVPLPVVDWGALREENVGLLRRFVDGLYDDAAAVNRRTANLDGPLYIFGAHVTSQYLISAGLDLSKVTCILDNNRAKQGLRLYGSQLTVRPPEVIVDDDQPHVIVRMANYQTEVEQQLRELTDDRVVLL